MTKYFKKDTCPNLAKVREEQLAKLKSDGRIELVAEESPEEDGLLAGMTDEQIREMLGNAA